MEALVQTQGRILHRAAVLSIAACAAVLMFSTAAAQGPGGVPPGPPPTGKAGAPIDLTGNWVSVITEDWRWRMVTPPKGDYASVPINMDAKKAAEDAA